MKLETKIPNTGGLSYESPQIESIELNIENVICVDSLNSPGYGYGTNDLEEI